MTFDDAISHIDGRSPNRSDIKLASNLQGERHLGLYMV